MRFVAIPDRREHAWYVVDIHENTRVPQPFLTFEDAEDWIDACLRESGDENASPD